jgi:hypothetical protein
MWLGDLQHAKTVFFEEFDDLSPAHGWWRIIFNSRWLKEFREDPEVAARLQEVIREKDELREQVREMLKEPEWRH